MIQSLWVPGPLPGLNEIIAAAKGCGGRGILYAKMKREWGEAIAWRCREQALLPMKQTSLSFVWREKSRRRDPDNVAAGRKFVLDALVAEKLLPDDGWDEIAGWTDKFEVSSEPGVLVHLDGSLV